MLLKYGGIHFVVVFTTNECRALKKKSCTNTAIKHYESTVKSDEKQGLTWKGRSEAADYNSLYRVLLPIETCYNHNMAGINKQLVN